MCLFWTRIVNKKKTMLDTEFTKKLKGPAAHLNHLFMKHFAHWKSSRFFFFLVGWLSLICWKRFHLWKRFKHPRDPSLSTSLLSDCVIDYQLSFSIVDLICNQNSWIRFRGGNPVFYISCSRFFFCIGFYSAFTIREIKMMLIRVNLFHFWFTNSVEGYSWITWFLFTEKGIVLLLWNKVDIELLKESKMIYVRREHSH